MPIFVESDITSNEVREKFTEHVSKFKCHILGCVKASAGPKYINVREATEDDYKNLDPYSSYDGVWEVDWNIPTKLYMCEVCHKWACPDHMVSKEKCTGCGPRP